jgi:ketosteroid isomerase-like protein
MQSIETENLQVIKKLLQSIAAREWADVRGCLADNVVFHFPGQNAFAGDYRGREKALELLARVVQWTGGSIRIQLHDILANEQHGVLLYTVTAKHGDKAIEFSHIDVYHIRDGQVTEVWGACTEQAAFDDFYSE